MNADPDDDALSWGDESDPTYVDPASPEAQQKRLTRSERRAEAAGAGSVPGSAATDITAPADSTDDSTDSADDSADSTDDSAAAPAMSAPMLLAIGILAGAYLLYTAGWFTSAVRNIAMPVGVLDVFMFQLREYLAVLAPPAWFGATLLLTRHTKPVTRLLWLVLGAIVLLPIPFILGE
jgi:hypothetical protein